jgi:YceI-like domain
MIISDFADPLDFLNSIIGLSFPPAPGKSWRSEPKRQLWHSGTVKISLAADRSASDSHCSATGHERYQSLAGQNKSLQLFRPRCLGHFSQFIKRTVKNHPKGDTAMSTVAVPAISIWKVDATHSVFEFKVKHMMISNLKGHFTGVSGTLRLNEADLTQSSVEGSVEIASIHTRDEDRDAHLKGADFFDAE